jgi:hypothetical protein
MSGKTGRDYRNECLEADREIQGNSETGTSLDNNQCGSAGSEFRFRLL